MKSIKQTAAKPSRRLLVPAAALAAALAAVLVSGGLLFRDGEGAGSRPEPVETSKSPAGEFRGSWEAALRGTDEKRRTGLLSEWAASITSEAMADMLEAMDSIADGDLRAETRAALLSEWARRDLTGALAWFGKRGGADQLHQQARDVLAQAMAARDPEAMVVWAEQSLPEASRKELYGPFFRIWAGTAPATAAGLLSLLVVTEPGGATVDPQMLDLLGQVSALWSGADVNKAVEWMKSLPEGATKTRALEQMAYQWAERDPHSASAYVSAQNNPALVAMVAGKWAEADPVAASAWARTLAQGEALNQALSSLVSTWAQKDPRAAAGFLSGLPEGTAREGAVLTLVSAWGHTAPAEVAAWVARCPGVSRAPALDRLMGLWTGSDITAASAWAELLPAGGVRDAALLSFSRAAQTTSPALAFQSAGKILDGSTRDGQLRSVAVEWIQSDPAAAEMAIAGSTLSGIVRIQLLESARLAVKVNRG
ncbi:MAG: hypothetical protein K0R17_433 [Rariglobus sp.]|jgi:hypothetical protein|nr:hypothetical protein [Rariglobus sp.]